MTPIVVGMVVALLVAFVIISVFASQEQDDWSENRPGHEPGAEDTHLGDLLDP